MGDMVEIIDIYVFRRNGNIPSASGSCIEKKSKVADTKIASGREKETLRSILGFFSGTKENAEVHI